MLSAQRILMTRASLGSYRYVSNPPPPNTTPPHPSPPAGVIESLKNKGRHLKEAIYEKTEQVREKGQEMKEAVQDKGRELKKTIADKTNAAQEKGHDMKQSMKETVTSTPPPQSPGSTCGKKSDMGDSKVHTH